MLSVKEIINVVKMQAVVSHVNARMRKTESSVNVELLFVEQVYAPLTLLVTE